MRSRFDNKLLELRDDVLRMGGIVEKELLLALKALKKMDTDIAVQVIDMDSDVNEHRYTIEEKCVELIATQQPAAGDLRAIVAVMNMIVDLERMGDQAKGIAKLIPALEEHAKWVESSVLLRMGDLVVDMLKQAMVAYADGNVELAKLITDKDDEVDNLYATIYTEVIEGMADAKKAIKVEIKYDVLRAAQELERFGDLTTNVAERVIYINTGFPRDTN